MTFRRRYLLMLVCAVFLVSFATLNLKYDSFNRISGIDNESRILISRHLNKEEKQFIIDQGIHVNQFIRFIEMPGFSIYNYKIYNMIEERQYFSRLDEIVRYGNQSNDQLVAQGFKSTEVAHNLDTIMINDMFLDFLNHPTFRVDEIFIYARVRDHFDISDASYIQISQLLKASINNQGFTKKSDVDAKLTALFNAYEVPTLMMIVEQMKLNNQLNIVLNPLEVTAFVNQRYIIGDFKMPLEQMSHFGNISPLFQTTYLQTEAANMFNNLCRDMSSTNASLHCNQLTQMTGWLPFESLGELGGIDDRQLALTLMIQGPDDVLTYLRNNASKFGFVIRNDGGLRYAGVKLATDIQQKQLTWEAYHAK